MAVLKGGDEMDAFQRELTDSYVALYCNAFAPYAELTEENLRLSCVGILGAADAISHDMIRGRAEEPEAADMLVALIVKWLCSASAPVLT